MLAIDKEGGAGRGGGVSTFGKEGPCLSVRCCLIGKGGGQGAAGPALANGSGLLLGSPLQASAKASHCVTVKSAAPG